MFKKICNFFKPTPWFAEGYADGYAEGMVAFTQQGVIIARNPALDEIMVEEIDGSWNRYRRVDPSTQNID